MSDPVIKTIEVGCSADKAFDIFVNNVASWWPLDKNSVSAMAGEVAKSVTIEPKIGGQVYETGHDDTIHQWGTVKSLDPGKHIALNWHINAPESEATLVEVTFTDNKDGGTKIVLVHSQWQVLGEKAEQMRSGYDSGWVGVFEVAFQGACA